MPKLTITSKRQATLPKELCEELGGGPGDRIDVERRIVGGFPLWVLRPERKDWSWMGALPVSGRMTHDMDSVRRSISRGRAGKKKKAGKRRGA